MCVCACMRVYMRYLLKTFAQLDLMYLSCSAVICFSWGHWMGVLREDLQGTDCFFSKKTILGKYIVSVPYTRHEEYWENKGPK